MSISSGKSSRTAFERIPRPQMPNLPTLPLAPTKAALQQREYARKTSNFVTQPVAPVPTVFSPATKSPPVKRPRGLKRRHSDEENKELVPYRSRVEVREESPWGHLLHLGQLEQGSAHLMVCSETGTQPDLMMIKRIKKGESTRELQALQQLAHPNIIMLVNAFSYDDYLYLETEYCRHTLLELMNVHLRLEEPQIRFIARSVSSTFYSSTQLLNVL